MDDKENIHDLFDLEPNDLFRFVISTGKPYGPIYRILQEHPNGGGFEVIDTQFEHLGDTKEAAYCLRVLQVFSTTRMV